MVSSKVSLEEAGGEWGSVGELWSRAWPQTVGEEGGRAVKAVGLWGP